jgi:mannose-6-phosphate isomerase
LLTDLCAGHSAEIFGAKTPAAHQFPLLIKLLDCQDRLSVQVHPDDETARTLLGEANGKTEAWVVMYAEPTARIYAGLLPGTTKAALDRHLADGTVDSCLAGFLPRVGDCFLVPAGTVHAAGGGVVLAEVQQSSDATFRLFDWNRTGSDGRPRQLHVAEAFASIHWNLEPVKTESSGARGQGPGAAAEPLVRCKYFHMDRFYVDPLLPNPFAGQISIWMVLAGAAELECASGGYRRVLQWGETVLVPASAQEATWKCVPKASVTEKIAEGARHGVTLLGIHLP